MQALAAVAVSARRHELADLHQAVPIETLSWPHTTINGAWSLAPSLIA
jgi:hypothetical protein